VGVMYWVPLIHCMLDMVGRGGMRSSGFRSTSFVRSLEHVSIEHESIWKERTASAHDQRHLSMISPQVPSIREHLLCW
jgi:hypothetical protein